MAHGFLIARVTGSSPVFTKFYYPVYHIEICFIVADQIAYCKDWTGPSPVPAVQDV